MEIINILLGHGCLWLGLCQREFGYSRMLLLGSGIFYNNLTSFCLISFVIKWTVSIFFADLLAHNVDLLTHNVLK